MEMKLFDSYSVFVSDRLHVGSLCSSMFQIQGVLTSFHGSAIVDLMLSGIMILNWDTFY